MYSQNNEEQIILDYFKNSVPQEMNLLDVGANDGATFSNSLALIELGWKATLLEPSPKAFDLLQKLHANNHKVRCLNYGITVFGGSSEFYESGGYNGGNDVALYSSTEETEIKRWGSMVNFQKIVANFKTYAEFIEDSQGSKYDFVTIDIEGNDWHLLKQMNLRDLGVKMLIVEWNSVPDTAIKVIDYCLDYGLKEISRNAENLILAI